VRTRVETRVAIRVPERRSVSVFMQAKNAHLLYTKWTNGSRNSGAGSGKEGLQEGSGKTWTDECVRPNTTS